MGFFISLAISAAFMVIGELLRPKPKMDKLKPSGLSDFQFPTADPTRTIGVFWGTCKFKGPNVTWFGDLKTVKKTKKVKTGWFSSTKQDLGINYYLGVQMVYAWGGGDVVLIDITVGEDEKCLMDGNSVTDNGDYYSGVFNSPDILEGTEDFPNGVKGPFKLYKGTRTQLANAYLKAKWGEVVTSGFRGVMYMVLEQCYLGNSDTPPTINITAKRCPNQLGMLDGMEEVNGDANFACMCYEVLVEKTYWGLSTKPEKIDADSFRNCALTLFNEGLGGSMNQDESVVGKALLAEFLRHVDGVIYEEPSTGLWTMKLARDDYSIATLPIYDVDNMSPGSFQFARVSYAETRNVIDVIYTDRAKGFVQTPIPYRDKANIFARDGVVDYEAIEFLGISRVAPATLVTARVGKTRSSPLARCEFKVDRSGSLLRPGAVLRLQRPDYGIVDLVMRVTKIGYGNREDPRVTVSCTEDIYAINSLAYGPPADTGWTPLTEVTQPLAFVRLVEAPYEMVGSENRHVMALGSRAEQITEGFQVWSAGVFSPYYRQTGTSYGTVASGTLVANFNANGDATVGFTVNNMIDPELLQSASVDDFARGQSLLLVDDEIMAWQNITDNLDGTFTISTLIPGVFDTVRKTHLAGARVWFFNDSVPLVDSVPYDADLRILTKLPTFAREVVMSLDDIVEQEFTTESRAQRPTPPGKVRINGGVLGVDVTSPISTSYISLSWQDRDKTDVGVISQDADTVGEVGTRATLRIEDADTSAPLFYAEHIVSPASFSVGVTRNIRVTLGAIDYDEQTSIQNQVLEFNAIASIAESYHVIYDEAFVPTDVVLDATSVGGVLTIDCSLADQFSVLLHENVTSVLLINVPVKKIVILNIKNPANYTVAMPISVSPVSGLAYVATTGGTALVPKVDVVGLLTETAGVLWAMRVSLDVNTQTGGTPLADSSFSVTIAPNPAYAYAFGSPSLAVAATPHSGTGPFTYAWSRAAGGIGDWGGSATNVGGADFAVSNAAVANPTFSRTGSTWGYTAQNWRLVVTDSTGKTTQAILEIALEDSVSGGGGGPCPWADGWLESVAGAPEKQARDVTAGEWVVVIDPVTGVETLALVSYAQTEWVRGVKLHTEAGVVFTCSRNAPMAMRFGSGKRDASGMKGFETWVKVDGVGQWSMVFHVEDLPGLIEVRQITCENKFFLVGDVKGAYMAHHNMKYYPNPFAGEIA